MNNKKILFALVFLASFIFISTSVLSLGVNIPLTTSVNYSAVNVNNSLYWQGHTGTDGSWLTGTLTANETDPYWSGNSSSVARTGNCPAGQVVMNTTTSGVQCVTPTASLVYNDTLQSVTTRGNTTTNNINLDGSAKIDFTQIDDFTNPPFAKQLITFNNYSIGATEFGLAGGVQSGFQKADSGTGNVAFYTMVTDGTARSIFGGGLNGDAYRRWRVLSDGLTWWGNGSANQDTNLYRALANVLRTDDSLIVGTNLYLGGTGTRLYQGADDAVTTDDHITISGNKQLTLGSGNSSIITSHASGIIGISGGSPVLTMTDGAGRINRFGTWGAGTGSAYITTNAYFDGSNWQRDQTDRNSVFLSLDSATQLMRFRYALAGTNPITPLTAFQVSNLGVLQIPKLSPIADSTTAQVFYKADGTTAVATIDTTNSRFGVGVTPAYKLDISGTGAVGRFQTTGGSTDAGYVQSTSATGYSTLGFLNNASSAVGSVGYSHPADKIVLYGNTKKIWLQPSGSATGAILNTLSYLGVGVDPSYPLHVVAPGTSGMIRIQASASNGYSDISFNNNNSVQMFGMGYGNTGTAVSTADKTFLYTAGKDFQFAYDTAQTNRWMYLNATNGLVEIGNKTSGNVVSISQSGNLDAKGNITTSTGYKVGASVGLTASYNCTSYPNVTITGGIITGWVC
jgi:hypothetical protein